MATTWEGRRVDAFIPAPTPLTVDLPERVVRATERAAASLRRIDDRLTHRLEPLARLLLRAEGVASSYIEGVRPQKQLRDRFGGVDQAGEVLRALTAVLDAWTISHSTNSPRTSRRRSVAAAVHRPSGRPDRPLGGR